MLRKVRKTVEFMFLAAQLAGLLALFFGAAIFTPKKFQDALQDNRQPQYPG